MKILISASNAFCKFIGQDLPRLPVKLGERVGVQRLTSDGKLMSWQVHIVTPIYGKPCEKYIIAVEAYSRYTLILKTELIDSPATFEDALTERWVNEALQISGMPPHIIKQSVAQFEDKPIEYEWVKNTDLSISGNITDTTSWLEHDLSHHRRKHYTENDCFLLGVHVNQLYKRIKISDKPKRHDIFTPSERILNDWLFRYAKGFSTMTDKNFPNPYQPFNANGPEKKHAQNSKLAKSLADNVIDFSKALKAKREAK